MKYFLLYEKKDGRVAMFSEGEIGFENKDKFDSVELEMSDEQIKTIRGASETYYRNGAIETVARVAKPNDDLIERVKNKTASKEDLNDLLSYIVSEKL